MICGLPERPVVILGSLIAMNGGADITTERITCISQPDDGSARCRGFKSTGSAQRFLFLQAATYNTFNVQRPLISASADRAFRASAIETWRETTAVA